MTSLEYSLKRITSILGQIDRLKQIEFPYKSSSDALDVLEKRFKDHQKTLIKLRESSYTPIVVNNSCRISLTDINLYLPILGFIFNSTRVENAFESYAPLLRLSQKILKPSTKLILSSEWDNIPFVYPQIAVLPDFVLIGLPAQESENPLLISLAGHELGHSIWKINDLEREYSDQIEDKIIEEIKKNYWTQFKSIYRKIKRVEDLQKDLFGLSTWELAHKFTLAQVEEIFCDFIGLKIFAESFLHALCYLIAPGVLGKRSLNYPNTKQRIKNLIEAAKSFSIKTHNKFYECFEDSEEPDDLTIKLLIKIADQTSNLFVVDLIDKVNSLLEKKGIPERSQDEVKKHSKTLEKFIPISKANSLSDILNAAWLCFHKEKIWEEYSFTPDEKDQHLKDLVLKSIEVFEIEELLRKQI